MHLYYNERNFPFVLFCYGNLLRELISYSGRGEGGGARGTLICHPKMPSSSSSSSFPLWDPWNSTSKMPQYWQYFLYKNSTFFYSILNLNCLFESSSKQRSCERSCYAVNLWLLTSWLWVRACPEPASSLKAAHTAEKFEGDLCIIRGEN